MEGETSDSTSITVEICPPKYQATIDKRARRALGIEGEGSVLQADLTVKRIITEGGEK